MKKRLTETGMEGRISQGKLESSMASINDLIRHRETLASTRLTEMTTHH